jgi:hypothetical protein
MPKNKHPDSRPAANPLLQKRSFHYHPSVFQENLTHEHPEPDFDKAAFSWIAPEYLQHPKSTTWWLVAGIVWAVSIILEAFSGNWTMLAATVLFGLVYWYIHEHHPPKHTKINLSELGVKIGHTKIPYAEIESFWIIFDPPFSRRLFLRIKDSLLPDLVIELESQNHQQIRAFLEQYLSERVGVKENFTDIILRALKL